MQVRIGNSMYDSEKQPILLVLSNEEKKQISKMPKGAFKYCSFPDTFPVTEAEKFMQGDGK